ncbi:MAG: hypothetical protein JNL58_25565 [Planctomyces sp.]|nr:hypothetical protein [Planctomyces sp.]
MNRVPTGRDSQGGAEITPESLMAAKRFLQPRFVDSGVIHEMRSGCLVACSSRVSVYGDVEELNAGSIAGEHIKLAALRILQEIDGDMLKRVEIELGPISDVDGDGTFAIFLSHLDCRTSITDVPIRGVVRSDDFLRRDSDGFGDTLYLDSRLAVSGQELRALLAHELAHASIYSWQSRLISSGIFGEGSARDMVPAWMHEGIAHCMERRIAADSENFQLRREAFFRAPANAPVMPDDAVVPFSERRGGARAATTLFLEYLLGPQRSPGVLLDASQSPMRRIEQLSGCSIEQTLQNWTTQQAADILSRDKFCLLDSNSQSHLRKNKCPDSKSEQIGGVHIEKIQPAVSATRLSRTVRGTSARYFLIPPEITHIRIHSQQAACIFASTVAREDNEVVIRLLSTPEQGSVASASWTRTGPTLLLPAIPTTIRSELRANVEASTF